MAKICQRVKILLIMTIQSKLIILVLLLVTIILSYSIYTETVSPGVGILSPSPIDVTDDYPSRLSFEELAVINPPITGSFKEREDHLELADKLARETASLDIVECFGEPIVFKTKLGQEITIRNLDNEDHIIAFNKNNVHILPANGRINITADFGFGSGIYGYNCDSSEKATGMVFVEL